MTIIFGKKININLVDGNAHAGNKGLESDPFKSPPAQQHFATVLDFH